MSSTFPSPNNCFYPVAHNSSYGYKVKDSTQKLTFNYGDVFNEYTNADANISCSGERTCYVGCTCKDGWNGKKNITSSGSSLTTASAGADLSSNYTIADSGSVAKTTTSASGVSISTMATGDNCTISVTDPRYGVTCTKPSTYDCAGPVSAVAALILNVRIIIIMQKTAVRKINLLHISNVMVTQVLKILRRFVIPLVKPKLVRMRDMFHLVHPANRELRLLRLAVIPAIPTAKLIANIILVKQADLKLKFLLMQL